MTDRNQPCAGRVAVFLIALLGLNATALGQASPSVLMDPTRPVHASSVQQLSSSRPQAFGEFEVEAIFLTAKSKRVIVNGQMLEEGDTLNNVRVVEIHADGVVLASANKEKKVNMNNRDVTKNASNDF